MIQKQWQIAVDHIEQFRGVAKGDLYADIEWAGEPITEQVLTDTYQSIKRTWWTPELLDKRDALLAASDWTQSRDVVLSNDSEWAVYRQALRDLPQNFDPYIDEIIWPVKPEVL